MIDYSVLDYAIIDEGETAQQALGHTIEMAQLAEELGYKRFWIAEHHNLPAFASASPEIIMGEVLNKTQHIKVGSGGVMVVHYSPYKVAEIFKTLVAYHPGRVDLGLGNNQGTAVVHKALDTKDKTSYEEKLADVYDYLTDKFTEEGSPSKEKTCSAILHCNPKITEVPEMWVLSNSVKRAKITAELGLGYVYGIFPQAQEKALEIGRQAAETYRKYFKPSKALPEPHVIFAAFVAIDDEEQRAKDLTKTLDLWLMGKDQFSYYKHFPTLKETRQTTISAKEAVVISQNKHRMITGTKEEVKEQLQKWCQGMQVDEVLLMPLMPGVEQRKKSLKLLAECCQEIQL
ncbi:MsnO8 family LLM class oxidoreductase [Aerococcus christensenii]|uniref:MsnO8 family LLM class oxidoreductase n=1 Tax=Aerococcus christensenii TaxID=87541 RepID=UPI003F444BD3